MAPQLAVLGSGALTSGLSPALGHPRLHSHPIPSEELALPTSRGTLGLALLSHGSTHQQAGPALGVLDPQAATPGPSSVTTRPALAQGPPFPGASKPLHDLDLPTYRWQSDEVTQSCPTLCNPMDYSLPGFSVHRIFQARVPDWVAISFSRDAQGRVHLNLVQPHQSPRPQWSACHNRETQAANIEGTPKVYCSGDQREVYCWARRTFPHKEISKIRNKINVQNQVHRKKNSELGKMRL